MASDWLLVRVELIRSGDLDEREDVRLVLVGPEHTFAQVADAVNLAFTRWGLGSGFEFGLPDGRSVSRSGSGADRAVAGGLSPGDSFTLVLDDGRRLSHRCRVLAMQVDVREQLGFTPRRPIGYPEPAVSDSIAAPLRRTSASAGGETTV